MKWGKPEMTISTKRPQPPLETKHTSGDKKKATSFHLYFGEGKLGFSTRPEMEKKKLKKRQPFLERLGRKRFPRPKKKTSSQKIWGESKRGQSVTKSVGGGHHKKGGIHYSRHSTTKNGGAAKAKRKKNRGTSLEWAEKRRLGGGTDQAKQSKVAIKLRFLSTSKSEREKNPGGGIYFSKPRGQRANQKVRGAENPTPPKKKRETNHKQVGGGSRGGIKKH